MLDPFIEVVIAAAKIVLEPIFGMSCESCGELASASSVQVVTKQPGSCWPAEGKTRPSERHDNVPLAASKQPVCWFTRCISGWFDQPPILVSMDRG